MFSFCFFSSGCSYFVASYIRHALLVGRVCSVNHAAFGQQHVHLQTSRIKYRHIILFLVLLRFINQSINQFYCG